MLPKHGGCLHKLEGCGSSIPPPHIRTHTCQLRSRTLLGAWLCPAQFLEKQREQQSGRNLPALGLVAMVLPSHASCWLGSHSGLCRGPPSQSLSSSFCWSPCHCHTGRHAAWGCAQVKARPCQSHWPGEVREKARQVFPKVHRRL